MPTSGAGVSPGEKPPTLSPLAKENNSDGALEFAVYYIKALDWSLATTNPYLLKDASAPSCRSCKLDIDNLNRITAGHGYVKGGRIHIQSFQAVSGQGDVKADYIIKFILVQEPAVVVLPTATTTDVPKANTFTSYVYVSWLGNKWLVVAREGVRS